MLLENRIVLVTGSSRGIGRAIAIEVAKAGSDVIVHYSNSRSQAADVVKLIEDAGQKGIAICGNLADANETRALAEEAWNAFGRIDVLVNNAGISGSRKAFFDIATEDFDLTWKVNVRGPFILTQQIAKRMIQVGQGRILTVTSVDAFRPDLHNAEYAGTKGALEAIMKTIALELSPFGIDVNVIAPGAVETDMGAEARANPELYRTILRGIAMRRAAHPAEIAKLVCFLASSESSYMTGSTVLIDGGLSLMRGYTVPLQDMD